jgi:hypothetical protein
MSDIWCWLALKLKMEIPSRQRTIINTLNTTTDRCPPARAEDQGLGASTDVEAALRGVALRGARFAALEQCASAQNALIKVLS